MTVFFLRVFDVLSSMRFGVFCLSLFFVIVLLGTFAQIEHGIFYTQSQYFHSWFLLVPFGSVRLPVFPGGALVGMLLVINLILGSVFRIKWSWKKCGLLLVHVGMIVLLLGASLTSCISHESQVYLEEGDSAYFSHDLHDNELVIIDASSVNYGKNKPNRLLPNTPGFHAIYTRSN
jgi:cytochrome c biogenesis factor